MLTLFTSFYHEPNETRLRELLFCIEKNIHCRHIDHIYILNEGSNVSTFAKSEKITIRNIDKRPVYNDFFSWINEVSTANDINIIANTDIYFDNGIEIVKYINLQNRCLALTRWDIKPDGTAKLFELFSSQDTWIFKGKIKHVNGSFPLGIRACDSRIAYEIQKAGYKVKNPAYSIKTYHVHLSKFRTYEQTKKMRKIPPPYKHLPHENLHNFIINCFYRLFKHKKYRKYHFSIEKYTFKLLKLYKKSVSVIKKFASKENGFISLLKKINQKIFRHWLPPFIDEINEPIDKFSQLKPDAFVVHIGANDGITNDPLYPFFMQTNWHGILIEPVKTIYNRLVDNYKSVQQWVFENTLIADANQDFDFYYYDIDDDYFQYSTLNRKILLHYKWEKIPDIENQMKNEKKMAITINDIIKKYEITKIDLLRINTVGYEYPILKSMFPTNCPTVILFSNIHLQNNYKKIYKLLKKNGYITYRSIKDSIAIQKEYNELLRNSTNRNKNFGL